MTAANKLSKLLFIMVWRPLYTCIESSDFRGKISVTESCLGVVFWKTLKSFVIHYIIKCDEMSLAGIFFGLICWMYIGLSFFFQFNVKLATHSSKIGPILQRPKDIECTNLTSWIMFLANSASFDELQNLPFKFNGQILFIIRWLIYICSHPVKPVIDSHSLKS